MTDTFEEEVVDGLDNDLGVGIEDDSDGTGVAQALLGLVGTALKEATVDVVGDEVVDCGLAGFCGRLALYHCSASGSVLNFLNLAPGNPWTYDWASSLEMDTIQRLSKKKTPLHRNRRHGSKAIPTQDPNATRNIEKDLPGREHANLTPLADSVVTSSYPGHRGGIGF